MRRLLALIVGFSLALSASAVVKNQPPATGGGGGSGTVTSVSVATANGFAGTVATSTTTPAITISTSITGLLVGNATAIAAATSSNVLSLWSGTCSSSTLLFGNGACAALASGNIPNNAANTSGTAAGLSATLAATSGGTGLSAFVLGQTFYASSTTAISALSGSTSASEALLTQTGTGSVSAAPAWATTIPASMVVSGTFAGALASTFPAAVTASKFVSNGAAACTGATVNYSSTASTTGALCANAVDALSFTSTLVTSLVTLNLASVTTGTNADFLCIASGGNVLIQSSACTISSRRFKQNIIDVRSSVLPEIGSMEVASFQMKPRDKPNADPNFGAKQVGLIAENVAHVAPECAIYEDDMQTPKSYRQECVIALLVKASQEQQHEIESLRHKLNYRAIR